jgi:hypothetical protein
MVYLATQISTGNKVAIKVISNVSQANLSGLENEIGKHLMHARNVSSLGTASADCSFSNSSNSDDVHLSAQQRGGLRGGLPQEQRPLGHHGGACETLPSPAPLLRSSVTHWLARVCPL